MRESKWVISKLRLLEKTKSFQPWLRGWREGGEVTKDLMGWGGCLVDPMAHPVLERGVLAWKGGTGIKTVPRQKKGKVGLLGGFPANVSTATARRLCFPVRGRCPTSLPVKLACRGLGPRATPFPWESHSLPSPQHQPLVTVPRAVPQPGQTEVPGRPQRRARGRRGGRPCGPGGLGSEPRRCLASLPLLGLRHAI